jgi:hypothetical protein
VAADLDELDTGRQHQLNVRELLAVQGVVEVALRVAADAVPVPDREHGVVRHEAFSCSEILSIEYRGWGQVGLVAVN